MILNLEIQQNHISILYKKKWEKMEGEGERAIKEWGKREGEEEKKICRGIFLSILTPFQKSNIKNSKSDNENINFLEKNHTSFF